MSRSSPPTEVTSEAINGGVKEWHMSTTLEMRNHLIDKIARVMLQKDSNSQAAGYANVDEVMNSAFELERMMYERANTRVEYYTFMAREISRISNNAEGITPTEQLQPQQEQPPIDNSEAVAQNEPAPLNENQNPDHQNLVRFKKFMAKAKGATRAKRAEMATQNQQQQNDQEQLAAEETTEWRQLITPFYRNDRALKIARAMFIADPWKEHQQKNCVVNRARFFENVLFEGARTKGEYNRNIESKIESLQKLKNDKEPMTHRPVLREQNVIRQVQQEAFKASPLKNDRKFLARTGSIEQKESNRNWLHSLMVSQMCLMQKDHPINTDNVQTLQHDQGCQRFQDFLVHLKSCQGGAACKVLCWRARNLISHLKSCEKHDCPLCLPYVDFVGPFAVIFKNFEVGSTAACKTSWCKWHANVSTLAHHQQSAQFCSNHSNKHDYVSMD